ncbi:MAG TPA: hypothetical protein VHT00_22900 [Stellaceae bacterium]|nr:hypothetical protein [Stellaceae bacterium]HEX3417386.1 hypothetical protein [Stellaceae bacterium]
MVERTRTRRSGIVGLIIQLVAGAVGGNVAASALKQYDLGAIGKTIAGIVGGGILMVIIGLIKQAMGGQRAT